MNNSNGDSNQDNDIDLDNIYNDNDSFNIKAY